jgi:hypothetical protein
MDDLSRLDAQMTKDFLGLPMATLHLVTALLKTMVRKNLISEMDARQIVTDAMNSLTDRQEVMSATDPTANELYPYARELLTLLLDKMPPHD